MPTSTGVASRKSARREVIVEAAVKHFSARQYEDVLLDDVCHEAGVAHGLVSYYFKNKRGLFRAAVKKAWQDMLEYERPRGDETSATELVRGYLRRHFEYVQQHAERFTGLMHSTNADPEIREIAEIAQREALVDLMASLGCPSNPTPELRLAITGWAGFLDRATSDWLAYGGVDLDGVINLCENTLVMAVRIASGTRIDENVQEDALLQVAQPIE